MKLFLCIFSAAILLTTGSCKKENNNDNGDQIPNVPVDLTINLDLAAYWELSQPSGWMYFEGGAKGILVYHYNDDYIALDRNCSYQPFNSCSRVEVHDFTQYLRCGETVNDTFKQCCSSTFQLPEGFAATGPATRPLKHYNVSRNGNMLYINN